MKELTKFRKNLIRLRKERNLTKRDFARKSGISYHTIVGLEREDVTPNPKLSTLVTLAKFFKVDVNELVK